MRLLLAEDDRIVRITVRDALEEAGFAVTACADGSEALAALEREAPEPGLGGEERVSEPFRHGAATPR